MTYRPPCFDKRITTAQGKAIAELYRVLHAVFDLGAGADPAELRKLYVMLKPGDPDELIYVKLDQADGPKP